MFVNLIGVVLIVFIVWWFWIKKPQSLKASSSEINIKVDNGVYTPSSIEIKKGQTIKLIFLRKDPSPCAEKVLFDDLGISLDLPINKPVELTIKPDLPGKYPFTCQMKMYVGNLIVSS